VAVASAVTPSGGRLAGRYDLGMLCVAASDARGHDALDANWRITNEIAAQMREGKAARFEHDVAAEPWTRAWGG
jgi:hypothetical protein